MICSKINDKGRIKAGSLSGQIYLSDTYCTDTGGNVLPIIAVMTSDYFNVMNLKVTEAIHESDLPVVTKKFALRTFEACAFEVEVDSRGKMKVPEYMQAHIGVNPGKKAYFLSRGDYHIISSSRLKKNGVRNTSIDRIVSPEEKKITRDELWWLIESCEFNSF